MKFEISKKTLIIIVSSVVGVILLWSIIGFVTHGRYEWRDFDGNFRNAGCSANFTQWNGFARWNWTTMMSGIENIIATKDYTAFQTLFSWTRMLQQIDTPEKFATRVELQTTIKKAQDLESQLWSGSNNDFGPMMFWNQQWEKDWKYMMWRENGRWNMMQRR